MVGGVIGNYRILRSIGEGGMGAVYLAEHTLIGRLAAIKVLLREMSHRQDLVTRFFNEARAATAVKHPGIVEIYDFGYHTDGSAYIVMEYLEGESLAARLKRTGTLSEVRAAALCRHVAGALGAAHAKGIVHRDLKPDNIYIVRDPDIADGERTKILDFGIAKLMAGELPRQSVTRTGSVMGTPPYMSPEQCKGAGGVDHRADLYALGCVLFKMVCGRAPFVAEGGGEIMAQHIYAPVPRPSSLAVVTPELEQVILRALAKRRSQRFQSAEEMIAALHSAVSSRTLEAGKEPPGRVTVSDRASGRPRLRSRSPALPPAAAMIADSSQLTTLSQASVSTSGASEEKRPRRPWPILVSAALAIAVVAVAVALRLAAGSKQDYAQVASVSEPLATAAAVAALPVAPWQAVAVREAPRSEPSSPATSAPMAAMLATPWSEPRSSRLAASLPAVRPEATPTPTIRTPASATSSPTAPASDAARARPLAAMQGPTMATPTRLRTHTRFTIKLTSLPAAADVYRMPEGTHVGTTPFDYTVHVVDEPIMMIFRKQGYSDKQFMLSSDRNREYREYQVSLAKTALQLAPPVAASTDASPDLKSTDASAPTSSSLDPFEKLPSQREINR